MTCVATERVNDPKTASTNLCFHKSLSILARERLSAMIYLWADRFAACYAFRGLNDLSLGGARALESQSVHRIRQTMALGWPSRRFGPRARECRQLIATEGLPSHHQETSAFPNRTLVRRQRAR